MYTYCTTTVWQDNHPYIITSRTVCFRFSPQAKPPAECACKHRHTTRRQTLQKNGQALCRRHRRHGTPPLPSDSLTLTTLDTKRTGRGENSTIVAAALHGVVVVASSLIPQQQNPNKHSGLFCSSCSWGIYSSTQQHWQGQSVGEDRERQAGRLHTESIFFFSSEQVRTCMSAVLQTDCWEISMQRCSSTNSADSG